MPVVVNDQVAIRLMMPLSLSYDHRLVDGATAARFLNDVIGYLENPNSSPRSMFSTRVSLAMTTPVPMRQFLSTIAPSIRDPAPMPSSGCPDCWGLSDLVLVGPHEDRVTNHHVVADHTSHADDTVIDHDIATDAGNRRRSSSS